MTYLEEAVEQLRKARDANEARAAARTRRWLTEGAVPILTEINQRRMEIADGFIRLAAIERAIPPDPQILPHELELRVGAALETARAYGMATGDRRARWVVDQMVRGLTAADAGDDLSGEYRAFVVSAEGGWDEGIAP
jgi:hypothetical protein